MTDAQAVKLKITSIEPELHAYYNTLPKPPVSSHREVLTKLSEKARHSASRA